jgi:hypothetical protein
MNWLMIRKLIGRDQSAKKPRNATSGGINIKRNNSCRKCLFESLIHFFLLQSPGLSGAVCPVPKLLLSEVALSCFSYGQAIDTMKTVYRLKLRSLAFYN